MTHGYQQSTSGPIKSTLSTSLQVSYASTAMSGQQQQQQKQQQKQQKQKQQPPQQNSIEAFHISAAREMHMLTTSSRVPRKPAQKQEQKQIQTQLPAKSQTISPNEAISDDHIRSGNCANPLCPHCGQVIIPSPAASIPITDSPAILINDAWHVTTQRKPILSASEIELFEKVLDFPVPEMIFGNNKAEIIYSPQKNSNNDNLAPKFHIMFNPLDALRMVRKNVPADSLLQVSYASEWLQTRQHKHEHSENVSLEIHKPFDWTYTSTYKGTTIDGDELWQNDDDGSHTIPTHKLTSNNPIKFYDDMILYEDELADNGISMLNIKIRVMGDCLLLLQRLFVRVDEVIVKVIDTRLYVDFDTLKIIREQKCLEDSYANVLRKARTASATGAGDPKKPLRDIQWCSTVLPVVSTERAYIQL